MAKYDTIDLFAGCGGFSTGFEMAGFHVTKAVEIDPAIALTYRLNHQGTNVFVDDISRVDSEEHFHRNESDVIIGGPPCQGFSMAGARIRHNAFLDDPRNYLFKHYINVVKIVRPKLFMLENVKGILTMQGGRIFQEILRAFSDTSLFDGDKYYLHYKVVHAVEYGIPQKRERVVLIGMLNQDFDIERAFQETREILNSQMPAFFRPVTVWEAISNLGAPTADGNVHVAAGENDYQLTLQSATGDTTNHLATRHIGRSQQRMKKIKSGENWTSLDEPIRSVHSGSYGRLDKDKPAATITTRFDTPSGGRFIHPVEDRTITPREAARLQSFPDSFIFQGTRSSVCRQIGNAVPPKLSYFLALMVKHLIYEDD